MAAVSDPDRSRSAALEARAGPEIDPSNSISIVIPAYNAGAYLAETLNSVRSQSLKPLEIIVVDDGSTDGTADLARSLGALVISQANSGVAVARNTGVQAARGEYIAYLDADDLWTADKLAVQFAALLACGRPAFSFSDFRVFDESGVHERSGLHRHPAFLATVKTVATTTTRGDVFIADDGLRPVLPDCYLQPSTILARRADIIAAGGFDQTVKVSEDYEFFLRLFKVVPAVGVMRPLMMYRRHSQQQTASYIKFRLAEFDIARRMAAAPERYPAGDVRHMAETDFVRYYRLGIEHMRLEKFGEAAECFGRSLAARRTPRAAVALIGARIGMSSAGSAAFNFLRAMKGLGKTVLSLVRGRPEAHR